MNDMNKYGDLSRMSHKEVYDLLVFDGVRDRAAVFLADLYIRVREVEARLNAMDAQLRKGEQSGDGGAEE